VPIGSIPADRLGFASFLLSSTSGNSLLFLNASSDPLTPVQSQVDGFVGSFTQQASDWRSLAAMMVGGVTYRFGRVGAMAAGTGRLASLGIGLGAEVTAFEMTNRSLSSLTGDPHFHPNLWKWEGQGGIRQGLLSSVVTFGTLKGAGRLAQAENVVVQHLLQDMGMVLGHQVSASFGITERPHGTLAEQFLHAEVTNLQLGAGMALAHSVAPGIQGLERGLELMLKAPSSPAEESFPKGQSPDYIVPLRFPIQSDLVFAANIPFGNIAKDSLVRMANLLEDGRGSCSPPPPERTERISSQPPEGESTQQVSSFPPPSRTPSPIPNPIVESLMDFEPIMIIVTDSNKEIIYANQESYRVLGSFLMGKKIEDLLEMGETGEYRQFRLKTEDSKELLWEDRQHPFISQYTVHYLVDITGKAENERLQDELIQLRIKAGEGFLARGVAHDVRSALTPGNMVSDQFSKLILQQQERLKEISRIVNQMRTARSNDQEISPLLDNLTGLVSPEIFDPSTTDGSMKNPITLLEIIKKSLEDANHILEEGRKILRGGTSSFSLHNVLIDALHQNLPLRAEKNIQLHTEIQPHLGIYGNQGGISEALRNILDNACQAMPQGGLLTIRAYVRDRNVIIEVADTGGGIPLENMSHIFDENFTTREEGTGLGLAMARKIIEEFHGGKIEVESEVGEGSTFRMILPHMKSDPPQQH
jgi:signal transduction histidine kinase